VQSEETNYTLRVSVYSGNAGNDASGRSDGTMFTTYDRDNDAWTHSDPINKNNCAVHCGAGFWYSFWCAEMSVNGFRGAGRGFSWQGLSPGSILQSSRMWLLCR